MPDPTSPQTQQLRPRDLLRPVLRRKWLILVIVALATVATYGYFVRQSNVYEASTKIFVGAESTVLDDVSGEPVSDRTIVNQTILLESRDVARAVARRLERPEEAGDFAASVDAEPSAGSDFVVISARRSSARDAAMVANAFARAFVQIREDEQRRQISKALKETQAQVDLLPRSRAAAAERAELNASARRLELALAVPSGSASQIDPATIPTSPAAPRPVRNALAALALALMAAIGLAFALESFDRRLRRLEDVEPLYGLPVLSVLPHSDEVAFQVDGTSAMSPSLKESFRQLRANIQLAALDAPAKRILVTSALAGEGKSTVVRNLAIAFRESGVSVALLEADLRRPALAGLLNAEARHGLTDVLTGSQTLEEALVTVPVDGRGLSTLAKVENREYAGSSAEAVTDRAEISLLPAGTQPANPQAILGADRTRQLIEEMGSQHDVVLIDSPPLLSVSDTIALVPHVDAVIMVARLGLATRDSARGVAELLNRIPDARPIGVVVNDTPRFEGYGYGYGYGDAG